MVKVFYFSAPMFDHVYFGDLEKLALMMPKLYDGRNAPAFTPVVVEEGSVYLMVFSSEALTTAQIEAVRARCAAQGDATDVEEI